MYNPEIYISRNPRNLSQFQLVMQNADIVIQIIVIFLSQSIILLVTEINNFSYEQNLITFYLVVAAVVTVDASNIRQLWQYWQQAYEYTVQPWLIGFILILVFFLCHQFSYQIQIYNEQYTYMYTQFAINQVNMICKIVKQILAPPYKINYRLQVLQKMYLAMQQTFTMYVNYLICGDGNVFMMKGHTSFVKIEAFIIVSEIVLIIAIFVVKSLLIKNRPDQYDVVDNGLSYKAAQTFKVDLNDSTVKNKVLLAVPFQCPRQLHFECHNPNHDHSKYYGKDIFNFGIIVDGEIRAVNANILLDKSKCYFLMDNQKLQQYECPICMELLCVEQL